MNAGFKFMRGIILSKILWLKKNSIYYLNSELTFSFGDNSQLI